jgi:septal ring factor EnvC (AmiA/AmiB activator)
MFGGFLGKIVAVQAIVLVLMAGGSYAYFRYSQSQIREISENNARLHEAVRTQETAIASLREMAERQNVESSRLQQSLSDAESTRRNLEMRLRRQNLEAMARNNSSDLEQRINRATVQAFSDLENITRSGNSPTPQSDNRNRSSVEVPTNHQPPPRPPQNRTRPQ